MMTAQTLAPFNFTSYQVDYDVNRFVLLADKHVELGRFFDYDTMCAEMERLEIPNPKKLPFAIEFSILAACMRAKHWQDFS